MFQDEIAEAVNIPVFTSSLMQVPLISRMLGNHQKVGVVTADASSLTKAHLSGAGIKSEPIEIAGMENKEEFARAFVRNEANIDFEKIRAEVLSVVSQMVTKETKAGAIVFECADMPP
jgi:calcineurin-like phosphoesterase